MRHLLSVLGLFCCGLACASLPRDSLARPDFIAPATSVTVNVQAAQTYGDFTFARTNVTLTNGNNIFAIAAHSPTGTNATNNLTVNLPSSVTLLYDANGNLTNDGTRSFAYSAENQLTNVTVSGVFRSVFVYDGLGRRRIAREFTNSSGTWMLKSETHLVYDGCLPMQERDANNNVLVTYTRGLDLSGSLQGAGGIGGLLARTDGNGSTFYHADGAGNITALMDGQQNMVARYLYGPFGRLVGMWGPMAGVNHMMFSSKEFDPRSGLYYYGSRFFDPTLQRWLSRDPIGERGDMNLYRGMFNSPLNVVDRDGDDNYLPGGENATAGLTFSMNLPVASPTPPSMGPASGLAVPFNQAQLPNPFTYNALLLDKPGLVDTPVGYDLAHGYAVSIMTAPGAEMIVGSVLGKIAPLVKPLLRPKCPPKAVIAPGAGYPSKTAGGTVYTGGFDPAENTLYLGDAGHPQGVAAAGGNANAPGLAGITVVERDATVLWNNASPSLKGVLAPDQKAAVQSALENAFSGKTVQYSEGLR